MLEEEFKKLSQKTESKELFAARDPKNYELVKRIYPYGERLSYIPRDANVVEDLQNSRGFTIDNISLEKALQNAAADLELHSQEKERLKELDSLGLKSHVEIGFRSPRLLKYFTELGFETLGLEISHLNVEVARSLGYRAQQVDISQVGTKMPLLSAPTIVTCYHVIEHTYNPGVALGNIRDMMPEGSVLHVEVPIEYGEPRLRYGHMSEFQSGDLKQLLEILGFTRVVTMCLKDVERCLAWR